jgi:hypothetical protein
MFVLP